MDVLFCVAKKIVSNFPPMHHISSLNSFSH